MSGGAGCEVAEYRSSRVASRQSPVPGFQARAMSCEPWGRAPCRIPDTDNRLWPQIESLGVCVIARCQEFEVFVGVDGEDDVEGDLEPGAIGIDLSAMCP